MEADLKEAVYALNRALWVCDAGTREGAEYHNLTRARDEVWAVGTRLFAWKD
jgi:hypothetical protein